MGGEHSINPMLADTVWGDIQLGALWVSSVFDVDAAKNPIHPPGQTLFFELGSPSEHAFPGLGWRITRPPGFR